MSLPASIPAAIIESILGQLALLFLSGANGDPQVARQAALRFLASYQPATEPELALAADIISFGFHVRQSLHQAAEPDRSLKEAQSLRSGAARLSREAYRCLVTLEQLQHARCGQQDQVRPEAVQTLSVPDPVTETPVITQVVTQVAAPVASRPAPVSSASPYGDLSKEAIRGLRPAEQKRIYLARMTENVRRRQAEQAALAAQKSADAASATQR